ncbi:regulatory protein RecX [Actinomycetes bacterium M1A6_2h]
MRYLTDRARSRKELADKLTTKGFAPDIIERVLDRLTDIRLIDDVEFAQQWVNSRHTYSGRGKRAIGMELRTKGISQDIAAEALDAIDGDDERDRARELVVKKIRTLARSANLTTTDRAERDKIVRKLVSMLARRGFAQGMAFEVVKTELEAHGADAEGLEVEQ